MCRKVDELKASLTPEERGAIAALGRASNGQGVPFGMAERLLDLGLAEVCCGGLDLTVAGRQVLESMRAG
jgi:hypothetical protein